MGLFSKFSEKIKNLFSSGKMDEAFFENLEDTLIEGDLGARLTEEIVDTLRKEVKENKIKDTKEMQSMMKDLLSPYVNACSTELGSSTNVFMILGVNGVGKTTSIAKMGAWYREKGKKVLLAAADTFRAAAVDQLDIHAERLGMRIVKQQTGSDPGAVVFDALTSALAQNDDLVLIDTAGRMHNKDSLMRELMKIDKIVKAKGIKDENYKKFLVIDATTGQNGVSQASLFNAAVSLDGIILTKYDSAAKGGALVQIGKTLSLPILFVGTGEKYTDLHPFDKDEYLDALIGMEK